MINKILNQILLLSFLLVLFGSCSESDLDLSPLSAIGDNAFYSNTAEVEGAVIAIYDGLQNLPLREFAFTEMRSDNTRTKSREGEWAQFESLAVQPTNGTVANYWSNNYNIIFRANKVLENLDVVTNAAKKSQFEGEAKFARALAHFNLVRAFGNVPIIDAVITPTSTEFFASDDAASVLAFIDGDFTSAAGLLPSKSEIQFGRATSGAANALLAKVKLTTGDHGGARTILSSLITDQNYSLAGSYNDVFYSEMNDEIIFAIPYVNDDANESQDFSYEMTDRGSVSGLNYWTNEFRAVVDPVADAARASVLFNDLKPGEIGKYLTSSSDVRLCGNDWIVIRLADVLLMHAESIMAGAGSTTDATALASVNKVRTRAGLDPIAGTLTKEDLLLERRIELAFENHRLYDLARFGMAETVIGAFATSNGFNFAATDLLLPIPQGEIDVSQGELNQNPGY